MNRFFFIGIISLFLLSCEIDEGKLPDIRFKTGANYVSTDTTLAGGSAFVIGIEAAKTESKDVLKKFNISRTVSPGPTVSIYSKDLSGPDGDYFEYDFAATNDTVSGHRTVYTFTVTNRDGLVNQIALKIWVK